MVPPKIENVNNDFSLFTKRVAIYIYIISGMLYMYIYIITIKTHIIKHHMSGCRNPDDLCSILLSLSPSLSRCGVFFGGIHVSEIHFRELSRNILKRIPCVPEQTHTETFVPHLPGESLYIIANIIPNYIELYIYIYIHYTYYTINRNVSDTPNINLLKSRSTPRKKKHCDIPQQIHGIWPVSILTSGLLQLWSFTSYKS